MLVYQHKIQPVRDEQFWKVHPSHAPEPPEILKMVGRSKVNRVREKNEARKREGLWSRSRKGLRMTCRHCSEPGHNKRKCPSASKRSTNSFRCATVSTTIKSTICLHAYSWLCTIF